MNAKFGGNESAFVCFFFFLKHLLGRPLYYYCYYVLCHEAYRILVPQLGIESRPMAVQAPSLNHWIIWDS